MRELGEATHNEPILVKYYSEIVKLLIRKLLNYCAPNDWDVTSEM